MEMLIMEIQRLQCPSCGGDITVEDASKELIYCQFCGGTIHLRSERNIAKNMELGRMDAINEQVDALMSVLTPYKDTLLENARVKARLEELPALLKEHKKDFTTSLLLGWISSVVIGAALGLCLLVIGFILNLFIHFPDGVQRAGAYLPAAGALMGIIVKIFIIIHDRRQLNTLKKEYEDISRIYRDTKNILDNMNGIDFPEKYRSKDAIDYVFDSLDARENTTLKQAFFKYDREIKDKEKNLLYFDPEKDDPYDFFP